MRTEAKNIMSGARRRGFTAIELTAVASIIAILALILIPIVRTRLESTRQTATLDDMRSIETAEVLANADTANYYPLQYLDNPSPDIDDFQRPTATAQERATDMRVIPNGGWNRPFNLLEQGNQFQIGSIGVLWKGPYITYNNTKYVDIKTYANNLPPNQPTFVHPAFRFLNTDTSTVTPAEGGPQVIYGASVNGTQDPFNDDRQNNERYPVDPWGNPYIYFGPGRIGTLAGQHWLSANINGTTIVETNFGTSAVFSTGPDGAPGQGAGLIPENYFRETGFLGTGDDFVRIF